MKPTQAEIAAHLGISQARVAELLPKLELAPGATLDQVRRAYLARLREAAANHGEGAGAELSRERAALAKAQRERIKLDMEIKKGEFIKTKDAVRDFASVLAGVKTRLRAIPGRVAPTVVGLESPQAVHDLLLAEIDEALRDLAAWLERSANESLRRPKARG